MIKKIDWIGIQKEKITHAGIMWMEHTESLPKNPNEWNESQLINCINILQTIFRNRSKN